MYCKDVTRSSRGLECYVSQGAAQLDLCRIKCQRHLCMCHRVGMRLAGLELMSTYTRFILGILA